VAGIGLLYFYLFQTFKLFYRITNHNSVIKKSRINMKIIPKELDKLIEEINQCKRKKTCPRLISRAYYFEPNSATIEKWQKIDLYKQKMR
jgi:hypothetical protein